MAPKRERLAAVARAHGVGAVARPRRRDGAVAAAVDRPVGDVGGEVVAPAGLVDAPARPDAAEVVGDDRELARPRACEELAEALAVGERQLRARAAVEVHAVDDALVGEVVVREQAQVARATRRREQDRRVHAGRRGSRARARAARRATPTTRCSGCDRRRRRRRTGRRPAAATRSGPCGTSPRGSSRRRAPARPCRRGPRG